MQPVKVVDKNIRIKLNMGNIVVTQCYICGANAIRLKAKFNNFFINRCNACGLIWAEGVNEEIVKSFYNHEYFNSNNSTIGYKNYAADEINHRKNARRILNEVSKIKGLRNANILDIGCAFGFLLDEAKKFSMGDFYGVEISSYSSEYAKNRLGLKNITTDVALENFEPSFFDVVFLIGTIEHLIYPKETLTNINRVLKQSGLLVITTVDTKGLIPLYSIKPPEHIFYFNHDNLSLLLGKIGFKRLLYKTSYVNYYFHDLLYRLGEFLSVSFMRNPSNFFKKYMKFSVRIPTNEMIIIAEKAGTMKS